MGENSNIEWTDHTFNSHWGCVEVGPGCDACYARVLSKRFGDYWGLDAQYRYFPWDHWMQPIRWNNRAIREKRRYRVFLNSMGDTFDNRLDPVVREDIWRLIRKTPMLDWQVVTKRIGNARKMLPADWGSGYPNVWLIATVCNQEEFDRDWPKLQDIPAQVRGLSIEPMLGRMDIRKALWVGPEGGWEYHGSKRQMLHWVIVGGESEQRGYHPRPMHPDWARFVQHDCVHAGVPFFFKQWGAWKDGSDFHRDAKGITADGRILEPTKEGLKEADAISPIGNCRLMRLVGKKKAGRLLDGIEYNEFPESAFSQQELSYVTPV